MLAYPRELPSGVASIDASEEAFGEYLQAIRDAVADGDSDRMALVLGDSATAGEATAFMNAQAGLSDVMGYQAEQHGDATTIAYFRGDSSVDSFPAFTIRWVGHRWVVVR
jgi:hypothetical protein